MTNLQKLKTKKRIYCCKICGKHGHNKRTCIKNKQKIKNKINSKTLIRKTSQNQQKNKINSETLLRKTSQNQQNIDIKKYIDCCIQFYDYIYFYYNSLCKNMSVNEAALSTKKYFKSINIISKYLTYINIIIIVLEKDKTLIKKYNNINKIQRLLEILKIIKNNYNDGGSSLLEKFNQIEYELLKSKLPMVPTNHIEIKKNNSKKINSKKIKSKLAI